MRTINGIVKQTADLLAKDEVIRHDSKKNSRSSQCHTTSVTMAVVCAILSGKVHIKEPLLYSERVAYVVCAGFPSHYLNGPLPYNRK